MCHDKGKFRFEFNIDKTLKDVFSNLENAFEEMEDALEDAFKGINIDMKGRRFHRHSPKTEENKIVLEMLKENIITSAEAENLLSIINKGSAKTEENKIILEMLKESKITMEDTEKLLKAVNKIK
jgi:hypothetical protein